MSLLICQTDKLAIVSGKLVAPICSTLAGCVFLTTPSVIVPAWTGFRGGGCACSVFSGTFTLSPSACGGTLCGFSRAIPGGATCFYCFSLVTRFCSPAPPGIGINLTFGAGGYALEVGMIDVGTSSTASVGYWATTGTDLSDLCSPISVPSYSGCLTSDCVQPSAVEVHLT